MDDTGVPANHPGVLAGHLAKLNHRLRHLHVEGELTGPLAAPGPAFGVVARLRVAATLLAQPTVPSDPALQRLGVVLGEFLAGLGQPPKYLPAYLMPALVELAGYLEDVFRRLDVGETPAEICADAGLDVLVASFVNAGRPIQCLHEMEQGLRVWQGEHPASALTSADRDELRQGWLRLRELGDALFGADEMQIAGRPRRVALLLDSLFRRNLLCERLGGVGWTVDTLSDSSAVMRRLVSPQPPELVLCDNLAPSLHLTAVRRQLAALAAPERPLLVLVASATGTLAARHERARHLGAEMAWAEPFQVVDLVSGLP